MVGEDDRDQVSSSLKAAASRELKGGGRIRGGFGGRKIPSTLGDLTNVNSVTGKSGGGFGSFGGTQGGGKVWRENGRPWGGWVRNLSKRLQDE